MLEKSNVREQQGHCMYPNIELLTQLRQWCPRTDVHTGYCTAFELPWEGYPVTCRAIVTTCRTNKLFCLSNNNSHCFMVVIQVNLQ